MLYKIENKSDLEKISYLFSDIRFFMGKSVLDGVMGEAYADSIDKPKFAILLVHFYCFLSGTIDRNQLKNIIDSMSKDYKFIPSDNLKVTINRCCFL